MTRIAGRLFVAPWAARRRAATQESGARPSPTAGATDSEDSASVEANRRSASSGPRRGARKNALGASAVSRKRSTSVDLPTRRRPVSQTKEPLPVRRTLASSSSSACSSRVRPTNPMGGYYICENFRAENFVQM